MSMLSLQNSGLRGPGKRWPASDRRESSRSVVSGRITALTSQELPDGPSRRISSLQLRDVSAGGVGLLGQESVPVGSRIAMFFPPHGAEPGRDCYGTIVRCIARAWGHELGVRLDAAERCPAA